MKSTVILALKAAVRERDRQRCVECGMTTAEHVAAYGQILDVHRLVPGSPYSLSGCQTLCKDCHRTKPRSPRGSRSQQLIKLPSELVHQARIVAAYRRVSVSTYLSDALRPVLEAQLKQEVRQALAEIEAGEAKGTPATESA